MEEGRLRADNERVQMPRAVLAAALLGFLAGCGGGSPEPSAKPAPKPPPPVEAAPPAAPPAVPPAAPPQVAPPPAPSLPEPPACTPHVERSLGDERLAYAAVVRESATAYRAPGHEPFASFGATNVNGHATVLGVLGEVLDSGCEAAWYHVQLPLRPNGATGYVRAGDVDVGTVPTRLVVDLSERRVTLFRDGHAVLRAEAAVGTPGTPTPTGRYYVNQRIVSANASGPWGPAAIGISAFSNVLTGWTQGGPIAVHGTNSPWSIGHAASNGCVRVANDVLLRLFDATPAGTPVLIRA